MRQMTPENNRKPLPFILLQVLCIIAKPLVNSNGETVWKRMSRVTLAFDRWPWKRIGHVFCAISSLCIVRYLSVNWNRSYSLETLNSGQNYIFFPCDLEIWKISVKNKRASLLCHFRLCASFRSHWWIRTGVAVQKRTVWVKIFQAPFPFAVWSMFASKRLLCSHILWIYIKWSAWEIYYTD